MPVFEFDAKKSDGSIMSGTIDAPDEQTATDRLLERRLYPLSVKPQNRGMNMSFNVPFFDRVKVKDLVVFSRQLSVMSEATLPLVQSLRILIDQTDNEKLKEIVANVAAEVDGGSKFSQALAQHPKVFSNFFVSMIRSGETSGRLDEVLNYLADQQEKDYDLMSKIRGAMIYPVFIVLGLIVVGIVMMVYVVPKLTSILVESGAELPLPTKVLIASSDFVSTYWWALLIGVVILGIISRVLFKRDDGRRAFDLFLLKLPIFGPLFQRIYLVRVTRTLVTLIQGGVPLPQALDITADVVGNKVYADLIRETKTEVDDGNPLASVFVKSDTVPVMVSQMMNLGEQTGRLDQVLEKLTNFYAREIQNSVDNLVSLIEPLIMVVMGIAVGVMVAAIILPMYNLATAF